MNYFDDCPDRVSLFDALDLGTVIFLKERGFADCGTFPDAPRTFDDARDFYRQVLTLAGDLAATEITPLARSIDDAGVTLEEGRVALSAPMALALEILRDAGLCSLSVSRPFGGFNLPGTINLMVVEMLSQAEASIMTLFALQEISWTIEKYGSEEQKASVLPGFVQGKVSGAMAFTEPDAGSDLAAVRTRARFDGQRWLLTGTKRFITNGDADVHLVLARSDEENSGLRGISLFLYRRDATLEVRRLEKKLGLHGSPTTELHYDNSPCELVGDPRMGLVRYGMGLMSNARLAVAAQSLGIAQAAHNAAVSYAADRRQFGRPISEFSAVSQVLGKNALELSLIRSFLYETSALNEELELLELGLEEPSADPNQKKERVRFLRRRVGVFVPMLKYYSAEAGQRICCDSLQIHGGAGYTKEFDVERHYRDIRVTSIYEGTSQIQINAIVPWLFKGVLEEDWDGIRADLDLAAYGAEDRDLLLGMVDEWEAMKAMVASAGTQATETMAKTLADSALTIHFGHRLVKDLARLGLDRSVVVMALYDGLCQVTADRTRLEHRFRGEAYATVAAN